MIWKMDFLIILSLLIVSSCVPNNQSNNKKKQTSVSGEMTGMVGAQESSKDKDKDDKDDDPNHNSKDTAPPSLPGFASFNKFYNASNFPIQFTWGVSVDANLSGYNYKICGTSDCRTSCGEQQSAIGTIPSGTIVASDKIIEGMNYACVQAFDKYKNITSFTNVGSFTVDRIAPIASTLTLQSSGSHKEYTNKINNNWITGNVSGASLMCLTNSQSSSNCSWIPFATSGSYNLSVGDGLKTVYLFYRDEALNVSKPISANIILDQTVPSNVALRLSQSSVTIIGGTDNNFDHYEVRFCDSPDCSNIISSFQTKAKQINLADMIAKNITFYTSVFAIDLADNMSNNSIVTYIPAPVATTPTPDPTPTPTPEPTAPVTKTVIKDIAIGPSSICIGFSGGVVKCVGENAYGQLGYVSSNYTAISELKDTYTHYLGTDFEIAQLKKGFGTYHCALSTAGAVKCWGNNLHGNLGQGVANDTFYVDQVAHPPYGPTNVDIGPDKAVQISTGGYHVCIVTVKGDVKCWGENLHSQLGLGHQNNIGDNPNEMGTNLKAVNLGTNLKALKVVAGWRYTCALLTNHQVKCWGFDFDGSLGDDQFHGQENDNRFQIGARASDMGDNLLPIYLGEDVVDISAGSTHVCAILASGKAKCWGDNSYAQLGLTDNVNRGNISSTNSMHDLPTLNFGNNKVSKISADSRNTCAILGNGETICWGRNDSGNLGTGSLSGVTQLASSHYINFGSGIKADKIFNGECFSCALITNGKLKCWGTSWNIIKGTSGSLGDSPSEMGDNLPYVNLEI